MSTPILTLSPHLTIRPYTPTDTPLLPPLLTHPVWLHLRNRIPFPYTLSASQEWTTHCLDPSTYIPSGPCPPPCTAGSGPALATKYVIAMDDKPIGTIGLDFGGDVYFRNAEVGYWVGEAWWGKGVMREVVPRFVEWAFEMWGVLYRVEASTVEGNVASGRCLLRAGLRVEGRRPGRVDKGGKVSAELVWGRVREGVLEEEKGEKWWMGEK